MKGNLNSFSAHQVSSVRLGDEKAGRLRVYYSYSQRIDCAIFFLNITGFDPLQQAARDGLI